MCWVRRTGKSHPVVSQERVLKKCIQIKQYLFKLVYFESFYSYGICLLCCWFFVLTCTIRFYCGNYLVVVVANHFICVGWLCWASSFVSTSVFNSLQACSTVFQSKGLTLYTFHLLFMRMRPMIWHIDLFHNNKADAALVIAEQSTTYCGWPWLNTYCAPSPSWIHPACENNIESLVTAYRLQQKKLSYVECIDGTTST